MAQGVVKFFDNKKGFGFIVADGKDHFVHYKEIKGEGYKTLTEGQHVEFDPMPGHKGTLACNVVPVD